MEKVLRLLIVEDVEDHALLIVRELQKAGFVSGFERIETLERLRAALETGPCDAIISDFSLPGFTALDTLSTVQEKGLDVPVIIVSGVIGEETAVDAMKAGAKDFILKGKYSRLGPALERELHEAALRRERKLAVEELVRAHEDLKAQRAELERQHQELQETYRRLEEQTSQRVQVSEELRQKEQMMIHQGRMAALGEMLNNIAHHWRQPLNVLALNLQDLALEHELGNLTKEVLDAHIAQGITIIQDLSHVIDNFREFSADDRETSIFKLDEVVSRTVSLLKESFAQRQIPIAVEVENAPQTKGYPNEFSQVLLNLLMNARDAIAEGDRPDPQITVRCWVDNEKAVATVRDNGGGIKAERIDKIFEPFYTTKGAGKGAGIGLFIAKYIIEKKMGGQLTARNVDDGAEFRIEVPNEAKIPVDRGG